VDPEDAPSRLRELSSWLVNQVGIQATRLSSAAFTELGASRYQFSVLSALEEFGPTSQAELGRRCGIDRSDIVAVLNELAGRRFVERRPDPSDARRNRIVITAAGRRRLDEMAVAVASVQDELLAPLSATDRKQLTRLLQRILDHHGSVDGGR
jgi:DNA-binding MarR family transcriptional regulator